MVAVAGLLLVGAVSFYIQQQAHAVAIDPQTSCPKDGPLSITAILLDVTDKLGPIQSADLESVLRETVENVPRYGRLDLYTVGTTDTAPLRSEFSSCNPGSGRDVASALTGNAALAERNWHRKFYDRMHAALEPILNAKAEDASPILESVQSVSVTSFEGLGAEQAEKKLFIVSDLLQYTKRLSFYNGAPDFTKFKQDQYYREIRTNLSGVEVTICLIPRETRRNAQNRNLLEFWTSDIADEGGTVVRWRPIAGEAP